jgi:hypothetical protein
VPTRAALPAAGATLIGMPVPRLGPIDSARVMDARTRRQLYLERASLIAMSERPVIVPSRASSGEQTQIVRRPVRKASGRRWIFIFGGAAATAVVLVTCLAFAHRAGQAKGEPSQLAVQAERPSPGAVTTAAVIAPSRPIVAPLADSAPVFVAPEVGPVVRIAPASGRHSTKVAGRVESSSRLAAHRKPVRAVRPAKVSTLAWVDPFVDR